MGLTNRSPWVRIRGMELRDRRAKISPSDAVAMRKEFANGATQRQLAVKFGLTYEGVRQVIRRRVWKGLEPEMNSAAR